MPFRNELCDSSEGASTQAFPPNPTKSKNILIKLVVGILLGASAVTCFSAYGVSPAKQANIPLQLLSVSGSDFGTVWRQRAVSHPLTLRNLSSETITVDDIEPGCSCTQLSLRQFELRPGAEQLIDVTLDLSQVIGSGSQSIPFSSAVAVKFHRGSRTASPPKTWPFKITAEVRPVCRFHPEQLTVLRGSTTDTPHRIVVNSAAHVRALYSRCRPEFGTVSVESAGSSTSLLFSPPNAHSVRDRSH